MTTVIHMMNGINSVAPTFKVNYFTNEHDVFKIGFSNDVVFEVNTRTYEVGTPEEFRLNAGQAAITVAFWDAFVQGGDDEKFFTTIESRLKSSVAYATWQLGIDFLPDIAWSKISPVELNLATLQ
ncbi:ORF34 [Ostreid herpesvirus 1]|uniref:Uncharacterized protein ORF34 n=1 Tax=Ostreid herpesvirus 1 (isolate France) TaxID=654903 RepID=Y034_OSHVF|nr:ORF34 [Ostreid herpesvirus 1]Q6R7J0.1 RecName: Full=Uncharacterized protein ORF34 [Ostreid herpesvirus 1 (isolate France)]ADD24766.1 ORF33 [Chlamys acute necrobiotic virus]AAS00925.1 ORF34 [Ostreid herpesvirus 1]ASK05561.1 ORF34 [Ostreid herpesvirus 1]ASK05690.1 ORF34 [Ostreid herpesvirus 1]AVQ67809.1 ORF34 [Ostreid herpesvirus 1]